MDIPVSSTLGFIGVVLFGFGLFLILAGLEIFNIQQVTVKKGPKTWGLGVGVVLLGIILLYPEISTSNQDSDSPTTQQNDETQVENTNESTFNVESTSVAIVTQQEDKKRVETNTELAWRPIKINIPNDGIWIQPTDTSYSAKGGETDSFAWSEEIVDGDFILKLDVESDFGNYGEGMVIIYGDGQTWSNGCLIFNITGYWQGIRINSIYTVDEENWLEFKERKLEKNKYTITI